jgi:FkbM family methyltransferase
MRQIIVKLFAPYFRFELPGWGRLLHACGLLDDELWKKQGFRRVRGKLHGYTMVLDLRSWSDRQSYFLRRYYDLPSQLLLRAALSPGDVFIDVGANIGMLTLMAARCVGNSGAIHSFEPNPAAFERLQEHVRVNQLASVAVHQIGLSDQPGELLLRVVGGNTGAGTFGDVREDDAADISTQVKVEVKRGDDVLAPPQAPTVLKMDVEGFELHVLRGFEKLLEASRPLVLAETIKWYLERAGSSLGELYGFMDSRGYRPFEFPAARAGLRHRLMLRPVEAKRAERVGNIAWIHPRSAHADRLRHWMPSGAQTSTAPTLQEPLEGRALP